MEGAITLSAVVTVGFSLLIFLAKSWFNNILSGIEKTGTRIDEIEKRNEEKISRLESGTNNEIGKLRQEFNDMKADLPLVFVTRDDYIRTMNEVEKSIGDVDKKMDKLMLMLAGKE